MVDYDMALVEHMKIHGSKWSQGAFKDTRLEILYNDAWVHLQSAVQYDGVIIDLVDPGSNLQKWNKLLLMVMDSLKGSYGSFVMNAGLYLPWKTAELRLIHSMVQALCNANPDYTYTIYTTYIPSFNGEWTFIVVHPIDKRVPFEDTSVIPAWIRRMMKSLNSDMLMTDVDTAPTTSKLYVL
jgi:spermidine synthase